MKPPTSKSLAWSFDVQRELPGRWRVTLTYNGRYGWDQARDSNYINSVPKEYYTTEQWNTPTMQAWNTQLTTGSIKSAANTKLGTGPML
jgi:hypothetical protein